MKSAFRKRSQLDATVSSLVFLLLASPAGGIEAPQEMLSRLLATNSKRSTEKALTTPDVVIDNGIDPDEYYVGTGDVFSVSVVGYPSLEYTAHVNQNGDIFLPELGLLELGKVTLRDAKKALAGFVAERLKEDGEVYVALRRGKKASVSVVGAVTDPGTYVLSGALRVLDALREANGGTLPPFNDYNYREVELHRLDTAMSLDVMRFALVGKEGDNPYLYPGDKIVLKKATRRILVFGHFSSPVAGPVPIREGETLSEFVSMLPLQESADSNRIVIRSGSDSQTVEIVHESDLSSILLKDRDQVFFSPQAAYPEFATVEVKGEVLRPGVYPIVKGGTTIEDMLALAGGMTEFAEKERAAVIRFTAANSSRLRGALMANAQAGGMPQLASVRPEISSALYRMYATNEHAVLSTRETGFDVILQNGDKVVVPRKDRFVYVTGNVKDPGAHEYVSGKSCRSYIREAGGFSSKADKKNVTVVSQFDEFVQIKGMDNVERGDVIIVPESQEYKWLRGVALPVAQTATALIGLLVGLYGVLK